ncbi:MAG: hypothetical protein LBI67_12235 [Treponema sp.]|jgi:hypothetical protein|nr:hypothetical protein [Treponema sp.]
MKNKLSDLNNHLFEVIERLNDDDLQGEKLREEIGRAHAISIAASKIIDGGKLMLDAAKAADELPGISKHHLLLE